MKKLLLLLVALTVAVSLAFALAPSVDIVLSTVIAPFSSLTINAGNPTVLVTIGQTTTIPYLYSGNELVNITITSAGGMNLVHTEVSEATIPYTMEFDYDGAGNLPFAPVTNGVAAPLVDTNGVYNLSGNFKITVEDGLYLEGEYADTITFSITSR